MLSRSLIPSDSRQSGKTRLLFVRRTASFGGSEIVILDWLKAIDYEKNTVLLACLAEVFSNPLKELRLVTCLSLTTPFTGGFVRMFEVDPKI